MEFDWFFKNSYFKTLKSDTHLTPVNRTVATDHHRVMGGKKEIYQDVRHRAIQL